MRIEFTKAEAEALADPFWNIDFTVEIDGVTVEANTGDDDFRGIPIPWIGDPDAANPLDYMGQIVDTNDVVIGYAIAHPDLTWEDETILRELAAIRLEFAETVRKAAPEERPALRAAKRAELRRAGAADARTAARVATRRADARQARIDYRRDIVKNERIAERLAERQAERDAADLERDGV